jgi:hypothetical protein
MERSTKSWCIREGEFRKSALYSLTRVIEKSVQTANSGARRRLCAKRQIVNLLLLYVVIVG